MHNLKAFGMTHVFVVTLTELSPLSSKKIFSSLRITKIVLTLGVKNPWETTMMEYRELSNILSFEG